MVFLYGNVVVDYVIVGVLVLFVGDFGIVCLDFFVCFCIYCIDFVLGVGCIYNVVDDDGGGFKVVDCVGFIGLSKF